MLNYGKYKGVILSVALFLLLDASVLIINFYTSFEIAKDAVAVNIAGRQRMLSQRAMKSLLDMQASQENPTEFNRAKDELGLVFGLFDSTLNAFDKSGEVQGAGTERVTLEAVKTETARTAVDNTKIIWIPFNDRLKRILNLELSNEGYQSLLSDAVSYGKTNNLSILKLMNDLTVELEAVARSKATRLRLIQTVGIFLAIINFFIIMFHFMRQLRESDEKIEQAQQETSNILDNVDQGLFLLDDDLIISEQHSQEMSRIFGTNQIGGRQFTQFIKNLVSSRDLNNVQRFFNLLFDRNKKQLLLGDLNPMKKVAVQVPDGNDGFIQKYLKFSFSRIGENNKVDNLLATVSDISQEVKLAEELDNERNRNAQQIEMMSALLSHEPDLVQGYIDSSSKAFSKVNGLLEEPANNDSEYRRKASDIFALVHNVKGESATLSLDVIADLCHEFEENIKSIEAQSKIEGNDFLPLTVTLDKLMSYESLLTDLYEKIYQAASNDTIEKVAQQQRSWEHLQSLASDIASRQGKEVEVMVSGLNDNFLDAEFIATLNSISVQFLRNAVSHGIETTSNRIENDKASTGLININFCKRSNGDFRYTFADDGSGIDKDNVIQSAIKNNLLTASESENVTFKDIIKFMFEPRISSTQEADMDSGQGVGLYSVKKMLTDVGAKLSVKEVPNKGVTFTIDFPAMCNQPKQAA